VASVNIAYDPNLVDSKYESNPVFSVFGALDLTFIVKNRPQPFRHSFHL